MAEQKFFSNTPMQLYTALWSKYRPAILQLMVASENGPQQYKLFGHEFKALNPKEKGGYSFVLKAFQGKAVNNIKTSTTAIDLLTMLTSSKKANELMSEIQFEFSMDKQFVLHVARVKVPEEQVAQ